MECTKIDPYYLNKHQASRFTSISNRSLDYARSRGELAFFKYGRKILYSIDDLKKYLQRFRIDIDQVDQ